jgi:hypothetical protein
VPGTAAARRADPHEQLLGEKGLLHEVHRAELHRLDGVIDRAEAGHDDHRRVHQPIAQLAQHVDAGNAGHPKIGEDDVVEAPEREIKARLARLGRLGRVAGDAQGRRERGPDAWIVVDDEHARHRSAPRPPY